MPSLSMSRLPLRGALLALGAKAEAEHRAMQSIIHAEIQRWHQ